MNQSERRAQLVEWSDSYYNKNISLVSDSIFDKAYDAYFRDYTDHELKSTIGSPVSKSSAWEKAEHKIPMGSLDKVSTEEEFLKWYRTIAGYEIAGYEIVESEKLDGISVDLEYVDGFFIKAITRGDGVIGEDITTNVMKMKGYPHRLMFPDTVSVRGEIILLQEDFEKIVELQKLRGDDPIKNKRNGAGGKAKDREGIYAGYLTIKFYDRSMVYEKKSNTFMWLAEEGFNVPNWSVINNSSEILTLYRNYENQARAELNYEIDGLVLEINDKDTRECLGHKDGRPRFAKAFKFSSMKAETIIEDVEWSVGKSGTITPIALLEPVSIGGVTVKRASLANLARFKELNLCLWDRVLISRRGDVIPYVESVSDCHIETMSFSHPTNCPECNSILAVGDKFLRCLNQECRGAIIGNVMKWVEKSGISGDGLGEATIEKLFDNDLINYPDHLYKLTTDDFLRLEGFQVKSATKMVDIIQNHIKVKLADFIGGLNINHIGSSLTQLLIDAGYDTLDKLQNLSAPEICLVEGFSLLRADDFVGGLGQKAILIDKLLCYVYIKDKEPEMIADSSILEGKSFCFTGAIQKVGGDGKRFTRKMMEELVNKNGGSVSSVKKGLTYLIQADPSSQSSKTKKAINLDVEILSEESFFNMVS